MLCGLRGVRKWFPASSVNSFQASVREMSEDNRQDEPERLELPLPVDWMNWEALKVLRRLHGRGHEAFLVGGCVRDLMLGYQPKDFDVATSARPRDVKRAFHNCRLVGKRFRLAHILFSGATIEVATFRKRPDTSETLEGPATGEEEFEQVDREGWCEDTVAPDPGEEIRPGADEPPAEEADLLIQSDNVFGTPREDAQRRDFTINGLFYDIRAGAVIDWVGGVRDLEARRVRTIGDPEVRFREDPVRMLRAIRFASRLHFSIDLETWESLCKVAPQIDRAAAPRLLEEVYRTLRSGGAGRAFRLMAAAGLLERFLVELVPCVHHAGPDERMPLVEASPRVFREDLEGAGARPDDGVEGAGSGDGSSGSSATFALALESNLAGVDHAIRRGVTLPTHLLLAVLAAEPVFRAAGESKGGLSSVSIQEASAELFNTWGVKLRVARRDREQARLVLLGCHKALDVVKAGRRGSALARKSYFADAVMLLALATLAGRYPSASLESLARFVRPDENQRRLLGLALGNVQERRPRRRRGEGRRKSSAGGALRRREARGGRRAAPSPDDIDTVDVMEET